MPNYEIISIIIDEATIDSHIFTLNLLKFLNEIIHLPFMYGTVHYHFYEYQEENLNLVSHQYRAWSDSTGVKASLALY